MVSQPVPVTGFTAEPFLPRIYFLTWNTIIVRILEVILSIPHSSFRTCPTSAQVAPDAPWTFSD